MENLHVDISRLITSDSRGKASVRNHTGAKLDSDLHVPARLLAWLLYELQMIKMTQFPDGVMLGGWGYLKNKKANHTFIVVMCEKD